MDSIQRAEQSKRILGDELVVDAFSLIERELMDAWKNCKDTELREEVWYTMRGLGLFKIHFEAAVSSGEFDRSLLEQRT
jgi:hypothetical protein